MKISIIFVLTIVICALFVWFMLNFFQHEPSAAASIADSEQPIYDKSLKVMLANTPSSAQWTIPFSSFATETGSTNKISSQIQPPQSDSLSASDALLAALAPKHVFFTSFVHGQKPVTHQKYIVLHDTDVDAAAEDIAYSWSHTNDGAVAAHFVVGRDGAVVQCASLDSICHHAGWGGPGDYDAMFDVGNNDGSGNGDDLVGVVPLSGYTSYGMNSYSIGIEMVHTDGEDYPEAQLESVDRIIAAIDAYYGFQSKIIDHKAWRPSNPDTEVGFASYLANYQSKRTHI